jgi:hypothetical protein
MPDISGRENSKWWNYSPWENRNMVSVSGRKYDDDEMAKLIAAGKLTHGEIARRLGVCRKTVCRIVHGRSRPELQKKINAAKRTAMNKRDRAGVRWFKSRIFGHIKIALEGDGEDARKSREYILDLFLENFGGPCDDPAPQDEEYCQ